MTVLDYILDGLEAELELERELGVRTVECDRSLLVTVPPPVTRETRPAAVTETRPASGDRGQPTDDSRRTAGDREQPNNRTIEQSNDRTILDFVFLHHEPLSAKGVEMMAKIITAMGKTAETAPVIVEPPLPPAKVYVILGGLALKKYFPALRGEPGQWLETEDGVPLLVTYSPKYILRFGTVTPAVQKMKKDMWTSLKAVQQRVR